MNNFVILSFVLALTHAKSFETFYNSELDYPFRDFYAYMQCVPAQIDTYAMEYDCETEWNDYREEYLKTITQFDDCNNLEDKNKVDG